MTIHWTEFPERVERFGELFSILETLDRDHARDHIHFECFEKETEHSAYTVELGGGSYHFRPRPERMPGLERLLARLEREYHAPVSLRLLRALRGRASEALGITLSAVDALSFDQVADALDAADRKPGSVSPTVGPGATTVPGQPDRGALDSACELTIAALRGARTLPIHYTHGRDETWTCSVETLYP
jgi:hypothetical protein